MLKSTFKGGAGIVVTCPGCNNGYVIDGITPHSAMTSSILI